MLPGEKENKSKYQNSQPQQGKTFAALLRIHLAPQPRVVYALHGVEIREACPARNGLVSWPLCLSPRTRECGCDAGHGVFSLLPRFYFLRRPQLRTSRARVLSYFFVAGPNYVLG